MVGRIHWDTVEQISKNKGVVLAIENSYARRQQHPKPDTMMVMMFSESHSREAHNCIESMKQVMGGVSNMPLVVFALDANVFKAMGAEHISCVDMRELMFGAGQTTTGAQNNGSHYGSDGFKSIMRLKTACVASVCSMGHNVLWIDTDIVFMKNPLDSLSMDVENGSHVAAQRDGDGKRFWTPGHTVDNVCMGFSWFRHCPLVVKLFQEMIEAGASVDEAKETLENIKRHDMGCVRGDVSDFFAGDQAMFNLVYKERCKRGLGGLHVQCLDTDRYCNGNVFFHSKGHDSFDPTSVVMVHNNFIVGTKQKEKRFKEHKLWHLSDDGVVGGCRMPVLETK